MASDLSNFIIPQAFTPYVLEQSTLKNALLRSGIVSVNPVMNARLDAAGDITSILTFKNLDTSSTAANASSSDPTVKATAETITGHKQNMVRIGRNKVWSAADWDASVLGQDPMAYVGASVSDAVIKWRNTTLSSILTGTVNTTVAAGNVLDVHTSGTAGSYTSAQQINAGNLGAAIIDAWGDYGVRDMVTFDTAIFMHPDTYAFLTKTDYTSFQRQSVQEYGFTTYLGMPVFVDSTLPKVALGGSAGYEYTTYFVKQGAINFGYSTPKNATKLWYDITAGNGAGVEYLAQRDNFSFHINGFSFVGTMAGDTPTDTELATASNWSQVFQAKQTGVAALVHNLA